MRARLALLVAGVAYHPVEVSMRDKPAALLEASPKGTVPVLVPPDGSIIDESLDIMRWALAQADPEDWLAGDDAALIAASDGAFKHHLDRYKYPERHGSDAVEHRAAALAMLVGYEAQLAGRDNLCRDGRSLTDMAVLPFVRQFAAVDAAWFEAQAVPRLHGWLARHLASPLFLQAMARPA